MIAITAQTYPLAEEFIQQSFLGASILDFSVNLGLNSNGSNLSVRLIEDDLNYGTLLRKDQQRNAVTEGYHPWDTSAFPLPLLEKYNDSPPNYGVQNGFVDRKTAKGDVFHPPEPGAPVYFKYYDPRSLNPFVNNLSTTCVEKQDSTHPGTYSKDKKEHCDIAFEFNGILTKYEKSISTSGNTYTVQISDPRELLENTTVILRGFSSRTPPADKRRIKGSGRSFSDGWNGYYNIINVFGFYEATSFGNSGVNEAGAIWYSPLVDKETEYQSKEQGSGILKALHTILYDHDYKGTSGTPLSSDYIDNGEPFGGPLYYARDDRKIQEYAPLGETTPKATTPKATTSTSTSPENREGVYRYKVDLWLLAGLSETKILNTGLSVGATAIAIPPILPPDVRINGNKISLLSLIQQVCDMAGHDFYVALEAPDRTIEQEENYAGVIRVYPIDRNIKLKENLVQQAIDDAIDKNKGPFTRPDPAPNQPALTGAALKEGHTNPANNELVRNSILVSANLGLEFSDPVTGKMLLGGKRTRVVGVTPLGDKKKRELFFYSIKEDKYFPAYEHKIYRMSRSVIPNKAAGEEEKDVVDSLYEFLPSIEMDGVTLTNNEDSDWDTFVDKQEEGWNEYGHEYKDDGSIDVTKYKDLDFLQNQPQVSNDDFLPFYMPKDFKNPNPKGIQGFDPFQLNRINSTVREEEGENNGKCSAGYCSETPSSCTKVSDGTAVAISAKAGCLDVVDSNGNSVNKWDEDARHEDKAACEGATPKAGTWTEAADVKSKSKCKKGKGIWYADRDSGYLDLYPCWGFEQEYAGDTVYSNALNDRIDFATQHNPIKGFFWDDDPYRDFNPDEGIFSNFEFYNPNLGECIDANGNEVVKLKNMPEICECNPQAEIIGAVLNTVPIVEVNDCVKEREAAGITTGVNQNTGAITVSPTLIGCKFNYYCRSIGTCFSASTPPTEITELHGTKAGTNNNLHTFSGSCTHGCFKTNGSGVANNPTDVIVGYYFKNVPASTESKEIGDEANQSDSHWQRFSTNNEKSSIKLVTDASHCDLYEALHNAKATNPPSPPETYEFLPIDATGKVADPASDGNTHSSKGGIYDKNCQALTHRVSFKDECVAKANFEDPVDGHKYKKGEQVNADNAKECNNKYKNQGEWVNRPYFPAAGINKSTYKFPIKDTKTGKEISLADTPAPGYVNIRHRFAYGTCYNAAGDVVVGLEKSSDFDCYTNAFTNLMGYNEKPEVDLKNLKQPRTSTIPVDISKFVQKRTKVYEKTYYYATVTELRHAAVSFDSWKKFLYHMQPWLPCYFYALNQIDTSEWNDVCSVNDAVIKAGVGQSTASAFLVLSQLSESNSIKKASIEARLHAGNKKRAEESSGTKIDPTKNRDLLDYEVSKMEIELIYNQIKDLATNFYGKKYLVPLPANPPTSSFCSGNDPKTVDANNPQGKKFKDKTKCEAAGYDWGPHPDVLSWLREDSETEINKWEIANTGWPGGEVNLKKRDYCRDKIVEKESPEYKDQDTCEAVEIFVCTQDPTITTQGTCEDSGHDWESTGKKKNEWIIGEAPISDKYPTNLNFWSDDGNLKAFVIFPSKEVRRIKGDSIGVNFENFDPEQVTIDSLGNDKTTRVLSDSGPTPGKQAIRKEWGNKVFVEVQVDPKTYWIEERPLFERVTGEQYSMQTTGAWPEVDKNKEIIYAKIGTDDNRKTLEPRNVESLVLSGTCVQTHDSSGVVLEKPKSTEYSTKKECDEATAVAITSSSKKKYRWDKNKKGEAVSVKKPYALITLPARASYFEDDFEGGYIHTFEVPLTAKPNSDSLSTAWVMGLSREGIAMQQIDSMKSIRSKGPIIAPDKERGSFIAAAYKPWHAAVPQQSSSYRWGPWSYGLEYGKPDFDIDDTYNPAEFGGELGMDESAVSNIVAAVKDTKRSYESGSVTLAGLPEHKLGFQIHLPVTPTTIINPAENLGPHITDMSVNIGTNGVNTTYTFKTQRKFGSLEKVYEERLRKTQRDLMRALVRSEEELLRVKRQINNFKVGK